MTEQTRDRARRLRNLVVRADGRLLIALRLPAVVDVPYTERPCQGCSAPTAFADDVSPPEGRDVLLCRECAREGAAAISLREQT